MGNCCKNKPILHVNDEKKTEVELKPIDKDLYGLSVDIWAGDMKGTYDIRFNFYSKTKELDQILYKSIHYICLNNFNIVIDPINYRNQTKLLLNEIQLNVLKSEIDKKIYANIKWRKLA